MTPIDSLKTRFYTAAVDRMDRGRLFRKMSPKSKLRIGIIAAVLASGVGIAFAQSNATNPPNNANNANGLNLSEKRAETNLSPAQMRSEAVQYLPAMEQSGQTIRRQLEQAREARDVVKVLCLNDKLNQVDVAVRSARDRVTSLNGAVERNDGERSKHEFTVIQVLRDRVRALSQEASQCIGEETGFIDEPKVSVEIDPAIPKEDPTVFTDTPVIIVVPPTEVSATQ
jgi:hypothetical protein